MSVFGNKPRTPRHEDCGCTACEDARRRVVRDGSLVTVYNSSSWGSQGAVSWKPKGPCLFESEWRLPHGFGPLVVVRDIKKGEICFHNDTCLVLLPTGETRVMFKGNLQVIVQ